jgi:hypothetical protein
MWKGATSGKERVLEALHQELCYLKALGTVE